MTNVVLNIKAPYDLGVHKGNGALRMMYSLLNAAHCEMQGNAGLKVIAAAKRKMNDLILTLSLQNNALQEYFRVLFPVTSSAVREQHACWRLVQAINC